VFRTHAGYRTGFGHLRRCLTLARALQSAGAAVRFVVNDEPAVLGVLAKHAVEAVAVSDADWRDLRQTLGLAAEWSADALVVDSYEAPVDRLVGIGVRVVAVIDDLADRPLPVTIVVNGAAHAHHLGYRVGPDTILCLGLEYVLLRAEFAGEPEREVPPRIRRALVTVGGADQTLLTPSLIAWAREALDGASLDVLVGPFWSSEARAAAERAAGEGHDVVLHEDPEDIRALMLSCDVALSGGGQTVYELAATATPSVAIRLFDNQTGNLRALSRQDALLWTGDASDTDLGSKIVRALKSLDADPSRRKTLGTRARSLVDGNGASRVAEVLLKACASDHRRPRDED
jgi:UDP-2,4-diacetamido-2,4,6-trideoxy-beta-L-altropyranose hydrolase